MSKEKNNKKQGNEFLRRVCSLKDNDGLSYLFLVVKIRHQR